MQSTNTFTKFADDATILCLTYCEESAYRQEVEVLVTWCHENNLSVNVRKTKEMMVEAGSYRRAIRPPFTSMELRWRGSTVLNWLVCTSPRI
ncbi:hypothetical protein LDENG_00181640 [Lucifuga dentata]|nr:hypothetical protein LDENG_00181640 [Lucifuga dentata]